MTALNKQALREAAERAASDSWGYDRDEFNDAITPEVVLALLDELEAAEKHNNELETYSKTMLEFREAALSENRHLKLELEIAERRIAELEARSVNLPAACADDEYFIDGVFQALRYERDVERAIRAAGIGVKGE